MGDMGLQGAYGAQGAADALRQLIKDKLERQQQQFQNNRLTANDKMNADLHAEQMRSLQEQRTGAATDRRISLANTLGDQLPAGTELATTDQGVGLLQGGGRGSLLRGNMTLPSTQSAGGMTMPDDSGTATMRGTLRSVSSPEALRSYTKLPSEKQTVDATNQADKEADNVRQAAKDTSTAAESSRYHDMLNLVARGQLSVAQAMAQIAQQNADTNRTKATTAKAPTGAERQTLAFYNRMKEALANIEPSTEGAQGLEDQIASQGLVGQWQGQVLPNVAQTKEQQLYRQAQRAFTEARLRKESGAAINDAEYAKDATTYFVQPGDKPETVKQKREARREVLNGIANTSGSAYREYYGEDAPKPRRVVSHESSTAGGPSVGDTKTFPNGTKAIYDGHGWVKQ